MIDVHEVVLDNGELEYLLFLRNPTGNFFNKDAEVWQGDWSRTSSKWTPKLREQCQYWVTEESMTKAKEKARLELIDGERKIGRKRRAGKKKKKQEDEILEETVADGEFDQGIETKRESVEKEDDPLEGLQEIQSDEGPS